MQRRSDGLTLCWVARAWAVAMGGVVVGGCVLNPVWGDSPSSRRDPIDFGGMASKANATLRVQAWNYARGDFDTLRTFVGGTSQFATSPDLFGWSTVGVAIPDANWVPVGAGCETGGMADLRVQELNSDGTTTDLATFDAAGKDCLNAHLAAGEHPVAAGLACKLPDETIVLFAQPQCVPATVHDATPPSVTVRLTDNVSAWQASASDVTATGLSRTRGLVATAMVRDHDGAVRRVTLQGDTSVMCRRASDGAMTVVPMGVAAARTQAVIEGVSADIGLEAASAINVSRLVTSTCPAGFGFVRIDGWVSATGTNTAGTALTSSAVRFAIL